MTAPSAITEHSILHSYLLHPSPLPTILPYTTFLNTCVPAQYRLHPHIKALYRDLQFQRNIDIDTVRQNIERECARAPILKARLAAKISAENGNTRKRSSSENGNAKKRRRRSDSESNSSDDVSNQDDNTNTKIEEEEMEDDDNDDDDDDFTTKNDIQASTTILESTLHPSAKHNNNPNTKSNNNNTTTNNNGHHTPVSLLIAMQSAIQSLSTEVSELESETSTLLSSMTETVGQLSDLRYGRFARPSGGGEGAGDEATMEDDMVARLKSLEESVRSKTGGY